MINKGSVTQESLTGEARQGARRRVKLAHYVLPAVSGVINGSVSRS
jgi:hypothetical protein